MAETDKPCESQQQTGDTGSPVSAIGNVAELAEGQVLLPSFISQRADGLFVDAAAIAGTDAFAQFAERVFGAGVRFAGLDYAKFQRLLHDVAVGESASGSVRLASAVAPFAAERRPLYKAVKIAPDGQSAEYMFEPVAIERVVEEPVYGEDETGATVVVGQAKRLEEVPARLDFDEFVADLWTKGVRYGIDAAAVRPIIASGETVRLDVAHWLPPTPGKDATLIELTEALHRDDSPRILADGRVDLRHFKNRFPQIGANQALLRKIPRVLGKPGRKVGGELVEPPLPADFDISRIAGPGTRVENRPEGECVYSAAEGFLNLDAGSGQVSITEKIVSREGVSVRTTGDLVLSGEDYEEHGEVQEKRVVEGKNMSFRGDVFGEIVSRGGRIHIAANLSGGRAISPGGEIVVEGRLSWALAEAPGGEVRLAYAEGSTIVASKVFVERAVYCQILAEEIEIGVSEGSAIAARTVRLGKSAARRQAETIVGLLVPDLSGLDRRRAEVAREREAADQSVRQKGAEIVAIRVLPEVAKFLDVDARIRKGEVQLNAAQEATWRLTVARFAPVVRRLRELEANLQRFTGERDSLDAELAAFERERQAAVAGIGCTIAAVAGESMVCRKLYLPEEPLLTGVQADRLRAGLRHCGEPSSRLFWGESGEFAWQYEPPAEPGSAKAPC